MKLSPNLRASFQAAYFESHGIEVEAMLADTLGSYLLELAGTALTLRAKAIHRARIDTFAHKRDAEDEVHPSPV